MADLPFERVTLYSPVPLPPAALPADHPFELHVVGPPSPRPLWTHWALARAARGVDLLFCPAYVAPLAYRGKLVVTIHDAIHELIPSTFPRRSRWTRGRLYRISARRAELVLTDSDSSRRDLELAYRLAPERVRAIHLGVDLELAGDVDETAVRARHELGDGPIVLFVGKFSIRRNLPTLVEAFARVRERTYTDATLALVGDNHLGLPLRELGDFLGLGGRLRLLGHVADADLFALYRMATLFVYPSDYEGFGLPVLEAMAAGTPVVTLDNSSLREVCADAAALLPHATVDGLAEAIGRILAEPITREDLARRGLERARAFRWADTARVTMDALAEVASTPRPRAGRPR